MMVEILLLFFFFLFLVLFIFLPLRRREVLWVRLTHSVMLRCLCTRQHRPDCRIRPARNQPYAKLSSENQSPQLLIILASTIHVRYSDVPVRTVSRTVS